MPWGWLKVTGRRLNTGPGPGLNHPSRESFTVSPFALVGLPLNDGAWEQGGTPPSHQGPPSLKHEWQENLPQPREPGEMTSSQTQPRTVCACGLGHGLHGPLAAGLSPVGRGTVQRG